MVTGQQHADSMSDQQIQTEEVIQMEKQINNFTVEDGSAQNHVKGEREPNDKMILSDAAFHKLVNMTSSIGDNSNQCDQSQHSQRLVEENQLLREQLELVKMSLTVHQEKAASTEMTMMDAIMQMKDQIQTVMNYKM